MVQVEQVDLRYLIYRITIHGGLFFFVLPIAASNHAMCQLVRLDENVFFVVQSSYACRTFLEKAVQNICHRVLRVLVVCMRRLMRATAWCGVGQALKEL